MKDEQKLVRQTIEIGGKTLEFEVGRFAEQASAAVLGTLGDTMILATVVSGKSREDLGYFPLFVEYQEKLYAGGRIKGSRWVKREGRPSDEAILNARLIDRSIRPLFPKKFFNETQVVLTVLSVDAENDPDILAINTASAALAISNIPWQGPAAGIRLGFVPRSKDNQENNTGDASKVERQLKTSKGHFIVNPTYLERDYSDLDLVVSTTSDGVIMVEAGANEVDEKTLVSAINVAQKDSKDIIDAIQKLVEKIGTKKLSFDESKQNPEVIKVVKKDTKELFKSLESPKAETLQSIDIDQLAAAIIENEPNFTKWEVKDVLFEVLKDKIRQTILNKGIRPDGRKADEIRKISSQVSILPRTHGSAMFKRGKTQALTITTLAAPSLEQWIESMEGEGTKRFMHHYYMPPYSVGEVGRLGWPSRREIGHGSLAERALEPMIPTEEEFPYTIRIVSELLSSNGSTSMAAVCGSTLSLMDAGVPLRKPVVGIAIGLIVQEKNAGKKSEKYAILSDIIGMEDHVGDMDFKVAGTKDGITAIQMDVKVASVTSKILEEALEKAHRGRLFILDKMIGTLPVPRSQLSKYAPKVKVIKIEKDQIGEVIGPGGKTIRQIIADTGASIDVDDEGKVTVSGTEVESISKATEWIRSLTRKVQVGEEFEGTVKRIEPFGAFVEILPGKDGLIHVSRLSSEYVSDPNQVVSIGDKLKVVVNEIDNLGRINLSLPGVKRSPRPSWQKEKERRGNRPHRPRRR